MFFQVRVNNCNGNLYLNKNNNNVSRYVLVQQQSPHAYLSFVENVSWATWCVFYVCYVFIPLLISALFMPN